MTVGVGTVLTSVGMVLNAFAPTVEFLYFSHGIVVGIGYGLVMPAALGIFPLYINHNFALANAIVRAGSGIGYLVFSLVMQSLIDSYGWRGACIVFAAIHANMLIAAALFRPPNQAQGENNVGKETKEVSDCEFPVTSSEPESRTVKKSWKIITLCDFSLFSEHPIFIAFCISLFLAQGVGFYGSPTHLVARAEKLQIGTSQDIAFQASVLGIGSLLGRVSVPLLLRLTSKCMTSLQLLGVAYCLAGVVDILSASSNTYALYTAFAFSLGYLSGVFFTLNTQVVKDMLGSARVTAAVSLYAPFPAIGAMIGPPSAGLLYDVTGDYNYSFYFYGTSTLIAGTMLIICSLLKRKQPVAESTFDIILRAEVTSDKCTQT
ncbi:monocarboxylate transporter 12-like [Ptychodera flava]|uniref:monocarboxylate transporter 12-like n=1 Tax=Ptychodera flava TaxID=63121 RepID=UPI00396A13CE